MCLSGGGLRLLQRAEHDGHVGAVDVGVHAGRLCARVSTRASARLTATVVLPTPPLPLATATRFFTPGIGWRSGIAAWVLAACGYLVSMLSSKMRFLDCAGRRSRLASGRTNSACTARNDSRLSSDGHALAPWHFLYFLPEPQGQGSLRPTFAPARTGFGGFGLRGAGLILQIFLLALLLALDFARDVGQALRAAVPRRAQRRWRRPRALRRRDAGGRLAAGFRPGASPSVAEAARPAASECGRGSESFRCRCAPSCLQKG